MMDEDVRQVMSSGTELTAKNIREAAEALNENSTISWFSHGKTVKIIDYYFTPEEWESCPYRKEFLEMKKKNQARIRNEDTPNTLQGFRVKVSVREDHDPCREYVKEIPDVPIIQIL